MFACALFALRQKKNDRKYCWVFQPWPGGFRSPPKNEGGQFLARLVQLKPEREFYCWPLATLSNPPVNSPNRCHNFIFKGPRKVFSHIIESSFEHGLTENLDLNIDNLFKFSGNWILLSFILLNTGHWNVNVGDDDFDFDAYSPRPCLTHLPHLRNVEASC